MAECPICKKSFVHRPACGLRLFNSDAECPICMEKKPEMLALPCGHIFCQEDLQRLGIRKIEDRPPPPIRTPPPQRTRVTNTLPRLASSGLAHIQNHIRRRLGSTPRRTGPVVIDLTRRRRQRRRRNTGRRRRCGWCGHIGHTIRRCKEHHQQCGCVTLKTARHRRQMASKHKCVVCGHKGHAFQTCANIVNGIRTRF